VWLFGYHGIAQSIRSTLYDPLFILLLLGLIVLSAAFHECGHATACRYGGARPGVMGVGLYIVWPAFYTDVTDAYRLGKKGRLRTDLGGVYFNTIFILVTAGAYFATGFEPLLLVIPLQHLEILHQFLPFIRLDGYYIVSDLTGVPDMFARIKPVLKSLLPWREADKSVLELKRWARVAVTAYVLLLVPLLAVLLGLTVMNLPRVFGTAWSSAVATVHKLGHASALSVPVDVLQLVVLILIPVGLVLTFAQLGRRLAVGSWRSTQGRPAARAGLVLVAAAVAAFGAYTWYPRGSTYAAISRGDRGTFGSAVNELGRLPSGHPPAAPARVRQSPARSPKRPGSTRTGTTTSTATTTGSTQTAQTTPTATTAGSTTAPAATTPAATTSSVETTTATTTPATTTATTSSSTTPAATTAPTTTTTP
jgi:putative peptide zinc metalloprotease protein